MSTIKFIRRLPSYSVREGDDPVDPFIAELLPEIIAPETLSELENYSRTLYSNELHEESFFHYERSLEDEETYETRLMTNHYIQKSISIVTSELQSTFTPSRIIPSNQMDSIEYIGSSAAGYGYIGCKRDNYELARRNATRALYGFLKYKKQYKFVPDKAFARCQVSSLAKPKVRHVWGRAFHNILIESLIGQNLLQQICSTSSSLSIGRDIHKDIPFDIVEMARLGRWFYCLDFSSFDATVNRYLVSVAFDIIQSLLVITTPWELLIFNYVKELFINTPVVMPSGKLYLVTSGIPSGSLFTQLVDSIVNLILMYAFQLRFMDATTLTYVMGDDSIFCTRKPICNLEKAAAFFANFGMKLNTDKSILTGQFQDVIFLGHNFRGSRVSRQELVALTLALYTEKAVTTPAESIIRIACLLYDSGFSCWTIYSIYNRLQHKYAIDWKQEPQRPASITPSYSALFSLS